jgi:transcriptional regulator with XRE-family HTH domain
MDGTQLRNRRVEKGLGQRKLSKLSGMPQREISKIENGTLKLRDKQATRLTKALDGS